MNQIYFVCTGNTCRSPIAAAIANKHFTENSLGFIAHSRGVAAGSAPASENASAVISGLGLSLTDHISRRISAEDVLAAHSIITMTNFHKAFVLSNFADCAEKVYTLGEISSAGLDISDPFGGNLPAYQACMEQIYGLLLLWFEKGVFK